MRIIDRAMEIYGRFRDERTEMRRIDQCNAKGYWYDLYNELLEIHSEEIKRGMATRVAVIGFLQDLIDNYDHDEDAHRYERADTGCRCCKAEAMLKAMREN